MNNAEIQFILGFITFLFFTGAVFLAPHIIQYLGS